MTTCISELMEAGWNRMQQEGIQQGRCSYFDTDRHGKIIGACALGAIVLGARREVDHRLTVPIPLTIQYLKDNGL